MTNFDLNFLQVKKGYLSARKTSSFESDHFTLVSDPLVEDFDLLDRVFRNIGHLVFDFFGHIEDIFGVKSFSSLSQSGHDVGSDVSTSQGYVLDARTNNIAIDLGVKDDLPSE